MTPQGALCSKHYRMVHRQQNETTCFSCGKRDKKFHKPINAQILQRGVLTDANQTTLETAHLCDACHAKDMHTESSACTSDAALQRIVTQKTSEAESYAGIINQDNCTQYAKTVITARLARKLRYNEGALLSDLFQQFNDILTENRHAPMTKSSYLLRPARGDPACIAILIEMLNRS